MSALCWILRHRWISVSEAGVVLFRPDYPFPVPSMSYKPDPDGAHRACLRCGKVTRAALNRKGDAG